MSSTNIEIRATSAITQILSRCNHLQPFINNGDKEPEWDGHVYFKSGDSFKRVPVQIKGKLCKAKLPNKKTYPINVSSLRSYLNDGGVVYYVVYLLADKEIPYYTTLAPVDLKRLIRQAKGNSSIAVSLRPMPEDLSEVEDELKMFELACKSQVSHTSSPILTLEDAVIRYGNIGFTAASFGSKEDAQKNSRRMYMYLYTTVKAGDTEIQLPVGDQAYRIDIGTNVHKPVFINGRQYFDRYTFYEDDASRTFVFGGELSFKVPKNGGSQGKREINIQTSMLNGRINLLRFLKAISVYKKIQLGVNDTTIHFEKAKLDDTKTIDADIASLERIRATFDALDFKKDIDLDSLTDDDYNKLRTLAKSLLEGKPFKHPTVNDSSFMEVEIGGRAFLLFIERRKDGNFKIMPALKFEKERFMSYKGGNGEPYPTSVFTFLFNKTEFTRFCNIEYSHIIESYECFLNTNPEIFSRANNDLLSALIAYDKLEEKDNNLIEALLSLNEWMIGKSATDQSIYKINRFQILKRMMELSKEEKKELYQMLTPELSKDQQVAIQLLVDNQTAAEILFEELTETEQKFFKSLPIYHFMKHSLKQ